MSEKKHPIKNFYYKHHTKGQYTVNGTMNGNIISSVSIIIGPTGVINGDVHARYINIQGKINGSLTADDYIELHPSATITGEVHAKEIIKIEEACS